MSEEGARDRRLVSRGRNPLFQGRALSGVEARGEMTFPIRIDEAKFPSRALWMKEDL